MKGPLPQEQAATWPLLPLAGLFAVALGLRALYLSQIHDLPFVELPMVDAKSYSDWGQAIAAGDWIGNEVFYQAPAYPYFLGVVYALFGSDGLGGLAPQIVQALLGATSCVFVWQATSRMFGRRAAWAAAAILAGYAPALFFDGMIQKASLSLFLTSGLLVLLTGHSARANPLPTLGRALALGAVCGLLALTRENALLFAVVIPVWMLCRSRAEPALSTRASHAAAVVLGCALVLLPVGFRNLAVGETFAITTSQAGPNFYIGNNERATGLYAPLMPGRQTPDFEGRDAARAAEWETGRKLGPGEVSEYWLRQSFDWIRKAPGDFVALSFLKILFTANDYEIPDTEDIYVHAEFSWLLAGLHALLRFGVLLPLAAAGLVFAWRERTTGSASGIVAALAALFALAVAAFYVWARYRFPLVPLLLPFAGLALARSFEVAAERRWKLLAAPAVALALVALISNASLFDRERMSQVAWINLGNAMIQAQRLQAADAYLERALELPHESADLHFHVAMLRMKQRRPGDAETHLERMLELDASDYRGHRALGTLLRERGELMRANQHLRESVRLDPNRVRRGRPGAPRPEPQPQPQQKAAR